MSLFRHIGPVSCTCGIFAGRLSRWAMVAAVVVLFLQEQKLPGETRIYENFDIRESQLLATGGTPASTRLRPGFTNAPTGSLSQPALNGLAALKAQSPSLYCGTNRSGFVLDVVG